MGGQLYTQSVPGQWDNVPFLRYCKLRGASVGGGRGAEEGFLNEAREAAE